MTYVFPENLYPLRDFLRRNGFDKDAIKTARQAAFVAQQIVGSRIKFPPPGSDMMPTLIAIQGAVVASKEITSNKVKSSASGPVIKQKGDQGKSAKKGRSTDSGKSRSRPDKPSYLRAFDPDSIKAGYHVFADGAAIPNPGAGGWGMVVYKDGEEIHSDSGGDPQSTNNRMEITAALRAVQWALQYPAVPVSIWTDSQYVVNAVNSWRHGWKANGWQRGSDKAEPKNRLLLNADLWREIDEALCDQRAANIKVLWVKGHAGHVGNERADELAEMGRQSVQNPHELHEQDLDAEYRAVMAG